MKTFTIRELRTSIGQLIDEGKPFQVERSGGRVYTIYVKEGESSEACTQSPEMCTPSEPMCTQKSEDGGEMCTPSAEMCTQSEATCTPSRLELAREALRLAEEKASRLGVIAPTTGPGEDKVEKRAFYNEELAEMVGITKVECRMRFGNQAEKLWNAAPVFERSISPLKPLERPVSFERPEGCAVPKPVKKAKNGK
jgi:hypothetical protein